MGTENWLMLGLGGRRLRDRAVGLGRTCRRRRSLEPADIATGGQRKSRAQQGGRSPKAAARAYLAPSHKPCHSGYSICLSRELIPAQQLNLPHPQQFDSWPATRLDEAADANPSIFEGLNASYGSLECRDHAPRNSRSKAPCPVPPEVQVSRCPRLPDGQNPAFDHRKAPDPGQNIARTFRVFYGRGIGPGSTFGLARLGLRGSQDRGTVLVGHGAGEQRLALRQKLTLHQSLGGREKHEGGLAAITVGGVVLAAQGHVAAGQDRRQRRYAPGFFGDDRFDAGEADLAAVSQAKGARIDDLDHAAFALRSNAHPAAPAGPVAATTSMMLHVDSTAIHPPRLVPPVTPFMTLPFARINC